MTKHSSRPHRIIQRLGGYEVTDADTYRVCTFDPAADSLKSGLGFVRGELDHLLGQFLWQPARESLVGRDNAQLDGHDAAAPDLDANGIRISKRDIVRFPEVCLFTATGECKETDTARNVPELLWSARCLQSCSCSTQIVLIQHGGRWIRSSSFPCDV